MVNPKQTLKLLDRLESHGFDDEAFARLHHFREKCRNETIASHRHYCETTQRFREGAANEQVQVRLKLVLDAYEKGGFQSRRKRVFIALAQAAVAEIPFS